MTKRNRKTGLNNNVRKVGRRSFVDTSAAPRREVWAQEASLTKRTLRASLMLGTALGGGVLAVMGMGASPAAAVCVVAPPNVNCTGALPGGIGAYSNLPIDDITIVNAKVGHNAFNDGATLYGFVAGETLTVSADSNTTIGIGGGPYTVARDGIHVVGLANDSTVVITSAAQIVAGRDAIFGYAIGVAGFNGTAKAYSNTTNSGPLTAGDFGIYDRTRAITFGPNSTATAGDAVSNTGVINSNSTGIEVRTSSYAEAFGVNGGTARSTLSVSNKNTITSKVGGGIFADSGAQARSEGDNTSGGTAVATTSVYNSGSISAPGVGIFARARSLAEDLAPNNGTGVGGTATASVSITNKGSNSIHTNSVGIMAIPARMPMLVPTLRLAEKRALRRQSIIQKPFSAPGTASSAERSSSPAATGHSPRRVPAPEALRPRSW